ncbi:ABC transporter permease [Promineifilum sp.]|uniref:ABC transporter permease n=1 Tax=Promineifilum sp. TaxID=2664178 RepID=UPI0035B13D62
MIRWRRFFSRASNLVGLALVLLFCLVALLAPRLAPPLNPADPWPFKTVTQSFSRQPTPPEPGVPLGTTPQIQNMPQYGIAPGQDASYMWDVYYTLIWGARSALRFGLVVTLATAVIGVLIGAFSGYIGGAANLVIMRLTDAFLAFPVIAGIWVIQRAFYSNIYDPFGDPMALTGWEAFLYRGRIDPIMITLILFSWMPYARLMNAQVRGARRSEYVRAAEAMGASSGRVIFRHLLPNTISPAVVLAARDIGGMVILASAFIFIGFGGNVAWGTMLVTSRDYVIGLSGNPFAYWWTFVPVSLALILFGVGWNLVGDGLNRALSPYER